MLKFSTQTLAVALPLVACCILAIADDFDRHIDHLRAGTPTAQVSKSLTVLTRAGKRAFPALIARLDDRTLADSRFQRAEVDDSTGKIVDPTIGRTCLGILQGQVEGVGPKSYRDFEVLNARTVKKWMKTHGDKTLAEMRAIATAQSLRRAEAALQESPDNAAARSAIEFFRDDYDERRRKYRQTRATASNPFDL